MYQTFLGRMSQGSRLQEESEEEATGRTGEERENPAKV